MVKLSKRAEIMPPSPIRKLAVYADQAKEKGVYVYHLNLGQPDIETPKPFMNAIKNFEQKVLEYGPSQGIKPLREAIVHYFERFKNELNVDDICVTTGGSEAILFALQTVCDPGDEVIVFEPFYTNYNGYSVMASVKLVPVTLSAENGFHLPKIEDIEKKITSKTKAIIICSPNNPTGTVLTESEMGMLKELILKHNLFLLSDECYKEFVYDGEKHISALDLKGAEDRVVIIDSVSKRFSACGARVGCVICKNKEFMASILKFAQARLCPPTIEQFGAVSAYMMNKDYFAPIAAEYKNRRDIVLEGVKKIEGTVCKKPNGAFYLVVKLPVKDADHFAKWLLTDFQVDKSTVMVSPANGFYATPGCGLDEIRIAYVLEPHKLEKAMQILKEALSVYKDKH